MMYPDQLALIFATLRPLRPLPWGVAGWLLLALIVAVLG